MAGLLADMVALAGELGGEGTLAPGLATEVLGPWGVEGAESTVGHSTVRGLWGVVLVGVYVLLVHIQIGLPVIHRDLKHLLHHHGLVLGLVDHLKRFWVSDRVSYDGRSKHLGQVGQGHLTVWDISNSEEMEDEEGQGVLVGLGELTDGLVHL